MTTRCKYTDFLLFHKGFVQKKTTATTTLLEVIVAVTYYIVSTTCSLSN
jgi:hypothetical protein